MAIKMYERVGSILIGSLNSLNFAVVFVSLQTAKLERLVRIVVVHYLPRINENRLELLLKMIPNKDSTPRKMFWPPN